MPTSARLATTSRPASGAAGTENRLGLQDALTVANRVGPKPFGRFYGRTSQGTCLVISCYLQNGGILRISRAGGINPGRGLVAAPVVNRSAKALNFPALTDPPDPAACLTATAAAHLTIALIGALYGSRHQSHH
jgi:hypothetical protein